MYGVSKKNAKFFNEPLNNSDIFNLLRKNGCNSYPRQLKSSMM